MRHLWTLCGGGDPEQPYDSTAPMALGIQLAVTAVSCRALCGTADLMPLRWSQVFSSPLFKGQQMQYKFQSPLRAEILLVDSSVWTVYCEGFFFPFHLTHFMMWQDHKTQIPIYQIARGNVGNVHSAYFTFLYVATLKVCGLNFQLYLVLMAWFRHKKTLV